MERIDKYIFVKFSGKEGLLFERGYGWIKIFASWRNGFAHLTVGRIYIQPHARTRFHYHHFEEMIFVVKGSIMAEIGNGPDLKDVRNILLEEGSILILRSNVPHRFVNVLDCAAELLMAISPHRDERKVFYLE